MVRQQQPKSDVITTILLKEISEDSQPDTLSVTLRKFIDLNIFLYIVVIFGFPIALGIRTKIFVIIISVWGLFFVRIESEVTAQQLVDVCDKYKHIDKLLSMIQFKFTFHQKLTFVELVNWISGSRVKPFIDE